MGDLMLTKEQADDFRAMLRERPPKVVTYNGRSAHSEDQLDFLLACEGVEDATGTPSLSYQEMLALAREHGLEGTPKKAVVEAFLQEKELI